MKCFRFEFRFDHGNPPVVKSPKHDMDGYLPLINSFIGRGATYVVDHARKEGKEAVLFVSISQQDADSTGGYHRNEAHLIKLAKAINEKYQTLEKAVIYGITDLGLEPPECYMWRWEYDVLNDKSQTDIMPATLIQRFMRFYPDASKDVSRDLLDFAARNHLKPIGATE